MALRVLRVARVYLVGEEVYLPVRVEEVEDHCLQVEEGRGLKASHAPL